jgi:hypothetical protein
MAAGLALVVGHGAYLAARDRLLRPRLAAARAALAEAAATGRLPPGGARALERLPFEVRVGVFDALLPSLAGAPRLAITAAARDIGLVAQAERRCGSRFRGAGGGDPRGLRRPGGRRAARRRGDGRPGPGRRGTRTSRRR